MGALEVVKLLAPLMDSNLNVANDIDGWTAMHVAAYNGQIEIIKVLAPMTDGFNSRDKHGDTPIDLATKNGHYEVVKFLESYEQPSKRARFK